MSADPFQPRCHNCGGHEAPFNVQLVVGGGWAHGVCGARICPVCGGEPAAGSAFCEVCLLQAAAAERDDG